MNIVKEETELHVITPDEPGIFGRVLGTLANAGINLRAYCVISKDKKGHFYLVTADNEKAENALKALGYKIKVNKVITIEVADRIGVGAEIGALLGGAIIDIKYSYGSSAGAGRTLLVFNTSNNKKALKTLQ
ncbi:MAG: ACT domain-containing protein [Candidatus Aminicenantes bacterium]|nr:ACT domain-containing protein [Candidatus Aminicenantes bacterium]